MNEPSTPTGKRLAEGRDDRNPFVARLIAIENEAAEMEAAKCDETVQALQDCGRDLVAAEDLADQLAEVLRDVLKMRYGEVLGDPVGTLKRVDAVLAAYDEARK